MPLLFGVSGESGEEQGSGEEDLKLSRDISWSPIGVER